jgi:long-chain acyl-CoA synthetase
LSAQKLNAATEYENFREIIYSSALKFSKKTAFQIKKGNGRYQYVTYSQFKKDYRSLGTHFLNLRLRGKRIAVIGRNSYQWVLHYLCAATVGVVVAIDHELSPEDMRDFITSAGCSAICADTGIIERLRPLFGSDLLLLSLQRSLPTMPVNDHRIDRLPIKDEKMSVLIFTSGTSGHSKGVCLSQRNICANIYATSRIVKVTPHDKTLSILPLHHTYECTLNCLLILSRGACIAYADSLNAIRRNLLEYSPTLLVVVPALLELVDKRLQATIIKGCPEKYKSVFQNASIAEALQKLPVLSRMIIRHKVKRALGGKIRTCIVGAADLSPAVVKDFLALGIRPLQGYGLTECAPLLAGNNDFYLNPVSTGVAIPGVELKIDHANEAGVGEILAKGDNVMLGYYNDPEATAGAFRNGYFCTGDLGYLDKDGALYIKGRMKNVIVTANGKNIYPEELEARLLEKKSISEALILSGNSRRGETCVKAKIFPNFNNIAGILGHLPTKEEIYANIKTIIDEVNNKMPGYKRIRVFEVLEKEFEKTTTRKIMRYGRNLA